MPIQRIFMDGSILLKKALQETTRAQRQPQSPTRSQSLQLPQQQSESRDNKSIFYDSENTEYTEWLQEEWSSDLQETESQPECVPEPAEVEDAALADTTNVVLTQTLRRSSRVRKTTEKVQVETSESVQKDGTPSEVHNVSSKENVPLRPRRDTGTSSTVRRTLAQVSDAVAKDVAGRKRSLPEDEIAPSKDKSASRKKSVVSDIKRRSTPPRRRTPTADMDSNSDLSRCSTKRQNVSK